jgi:hypothetical protein
VTAADVVVQGAPDDVLLRAVPVLRGMRARITRYDGEEGTLEARRMRYGVASTIRLRAAAHGEDVTRLHIESEAGGRWRLARRIVSAWNVRTVRRHLGS